jgi:hypothetical protein
MNGNFRVRAVKVAAPASLALLFLPSCATIHVDPIEVKPIHIVHDINIRVDRQLDDFFAFQEKMAASTQPVATQPATPQTAGASQQSKGVTP